MIFWPFEINRCKPTTVSDLVSIMTQMARSKLNVTLRESPNNAKEYDLILTYDNKEIGHKSITIKDFNMNRLLEQMSFHLSELGNNK